MKQVLNIIAIIGIILFASCGGGGDSSDFDSQNGGGILTDMGDVTNTALPGTVFYFSNTDSYEVSAQIGAPVVVVDSFTVSNKYKITNNVDFEDGNELN